MKAAYPATETQIHAHELRAEDAEEAPADDTTGEWRLMRARNKWQTPENCGHHPFPGTFPGGGHRPVRRWGGWRTPGAQYPTAIPTRSRCRPA